MVLGQTELASRSESNKSIKEGNVILKAILCIEVESVFCFEITGEKEEW